MAKFCKYCGAALDEGAGFCPGCGTPQSAAPAPAQPQLPVYQQSPQPQYQQPPPRPQYQQPPQRSGNTGYSPVANTPEFRQLAAKKYNKNLNSSRFFTPLICIGAALFVAGFWSLNDSVITNFIVTAVGIAVAVAAVLDHLKQAASKNQPLVEMTVVKHESSGGTMEQPRVSYGVVFKDAAGKTESQYADGNTLVQEYYQIGDRCLYHSDIRFFEKYDKSRDPFSICPFCGRRVALGHARCTHCKKPLLI